MSEEEMKRNKDFDKNALKTMGSAWEGLGLGEVPPGFVAKMLESAKRRGRRR